jgi:hypothetical protein
MIYFQTPLYVQTTLQARINQLEDVLRALLDDDNEATRADAQRALECS